MLNRNHSNYRFALAVGSALVASILFAVVSLFQAASGATAYLS